MPVKARYMTQIATKTMREGAPGSVITLLNGRTVKIVRPVMEETPEAKAERLEQESREREQARARDSRYRTTEARKVSRKEFEKTAARKAVRAAKETARVARKRQMKKDAPFIAIDTEGASMHDRTWTEGEGTPEKAVYEPQKIIVLAAGREDDVLMLSHAKGGEKGEDVPGLSSVDMLSWLAIFRAVVRKALNLLSVLWI
jgi:hypothetical protein